jgi:hypothetical protein
VTFEHKPQEIERKAKKPAAKLQCLKRMKLDTTGAFHQNIAKLLEASYSFQSKGS